MSIPLLVGRKCSLVVDYLSFVQEILVQKNAGSSKQEEELQEGP
ncbi:MAG: hypothetical protein PVS3B3_35470 [Ktedonobacteraceae bacterium]